MARSSELMRQWPSKLEKALAVFSDTLDLVKKKKRGFGLPSIIYVKSFMIQKNYARSIETGTSAEKKILSRSVDFCTSEKIECTPRSVNSGTSEVTKSTPLEVPESAPLNNKTKHIGGRNICPGIGVRSERLRWKIYYWRMRGWKNYIR